MNFVLPDYQVSEPTWFYLSFLLIIAVFFKFSRLWSLRNLDLLLLLSISPGLLLLKSHPNVGYGWLFVTTGAFLLRALTDGAILRRPRLDPNMNAAGLTFLCAASFAFLMTKVMTDKPEQQALQMVKQSHQLLQRQADAPAESTPKTAADAGPASSLIAAPVTAISKVAAPETTQETDYPIFAARTLAILAHLAVILGLVFVGKSLFNDLDAGVAMATLYMLLPCTAYDVSKVNHVFPAALIVWAIGAYRQPLISGCLLGLASGIMIFPIFLLPLWTVFYGKRGGLQFVGALATVAAVILGSLAFISTDTHTFMQQIFGWFDHARMQFRITEPVNEQTIGFWHQTVYRIPVFVAFVIMLIGLSIWPARKSMAHVISHSAAIVLGIQFWFPQQGGVYVLWYLPLLLLVSFRPMMTNHFAPDVMPLPWSRQGRAARAARAAQTSTSLTTSAMMGRPMMR